MDVLNALPMDRRIRILSTGLPTFFGFSELCTGNQVSDKMTGFKCEYGCYTTGLLFRGHEF